MNSIKSVGIIECGLLDETSMKDRVGNTNGIRLKKILVKNEAGKTTAQQLFPQAELVGDAAAILQDDSIELVLVADPQEADKDLIREVLNTGKYVRII